MKKSSLASSKKQENNDLIICGIDEAGRGPVFGPMIVCGVCFYKNQLEFLKTIGVKDSKKLSPTQREGLALILKNNSLNLKLTKISVEEIDQREQQKLTLNQIEELHMARIINDLMPDEVYIDAADVSEQRFLNSIKKRLNYKPKKIIAEHKADVKYPIVSASSILAKVERDFHIDQLKRKFGDFGSGYPSDMKSVRFLREWILKNKKVPPFARKTWQTTTNILDMELRNKKITEFTKL